MILGTRNGDILEGVIQVGALMRTSEAPTTHKLSQENLSQSSSEEDEEEKEDQERGDQPEETPEVVLSRKSLDYDKSPSVKKEGDRTKNLIEVSYSLFLRNHSGAAANAKNYKKKLIFAVHPHLSILITIGEDQRMCVWDTKNFRLLKSHDTGFGVTAIKFVPDNGDMLALGLANCRILIIDSKFVVNNFGQVNERTFVIAFAISLSQLLIGYVLPEFDVIQTIKDKDSKTLILNIEFSARGDLMAVSYGMKSLLSYVGQQLSHR